MYHCSLFLYDKFVSGDISDIVRSPLQSSPLQSGDQPCIEHGMWQNSVSIFGSIVDFVSDRQSQF